MGTNYTARCRPKRIAGLLTAAALLLLLAVQAAPAQGIVVHRDVQYYFGPGASRERHSLDLFLPGSGSDYPVVLFIHGGGWTGGDKNEVPGLLYENVGRALAEREIGVAVVNYRLTDGTADNVVHPGHVEDVARAFSFMRAYLVTGGNNPNNLYLAGHEAGAHLAALLATNDRFLSAHGLAPAAVRGVIGLSGIYRIDPDGDEYAAVFGVDPAVRRDGSPIHHVSAQAPPFLLLYGDFDRTGLDEEARSMGRALGVADVTVGVHEIPGRSHGSMVSSIGQAGDETTERIASFVFGRRYLTPTPTATATGTPTPTATATPTPTATSAPVTPPGQPLGGPGGAERRHGRVRVTRSGDDAQLYWLFEPADPVPSEAPVVAFLHGAGPLDPAPYRTWLEHIARGGVVVVYPAYRVSGDDDTGGWTESAASALRSALDELAYGSHVRPMAGQLAYVGHGEGAVLAANLAAGWFKWQLPLPRALMVMMPRRAIELLDEDLRRVPNDTRTLFVAGEDDAGYDNATEVRLWDGLRHIPGAWRERLLLRTDRYGTPPLVAGYAAPLADGPAGALDALDWYGSWKWLDGLTTCALTHTNCPYAFGHTPEQRNMGRWADGRPVRPAIVSDDVPRPPMWLTYVPLAVLR